MTVHGVVGRSNGRIVGLSAGVWVGAYLIARLLLELDRLSAWTRAAIALAPVSAFVWFLREFVGSVSRADELERRIQLEALAVAFPLTLLLIMTLGLLQIAVALPVEDWSYRHIWPFLYVFYLIGLTRARRRYA